MKWNTAYVPYNIIDHLPLVWRGLYFSRYMYTVFTSKKYDIIIVVNYNILIPLVSELAETDVFRLFARYPVSVALKARWWSAYWWKSTTVWPGPRRRTVAGRIDEASVRRSTTATNRKPFAARWQNGQRMSWEQRAGTASWTQLRDWGSGRRTHAPSTWRWVVGRRIWRVSGVRWPRTPRNPLREPRRPPRRITVTGGRLRFLAFAGGRIRCRSLCATSSRCDPSSFEWTGIS